MQKAKKLVGVLLLVTLLAAVVYIIVGVVQTLTAGGATSFPWYTAPVFAALLFGPFFAMELVAYLILRHKCK